MSTRLHDIIVLKDKGCNGTAQHGKRAKSIAVRIIKY